MRRRPRHFALGLSLAILTLLADQASKWEVLSMFRPVGETATPFPPPAPIEVLPILDFDLVWNHGVSFGVGNTGSTWNAVLFAALAIVIAAVLLVWMARTRRAALAVALGLIVGGAAGNVVDRLRFGAVVDFLYVHIGGFNWWPSFNIADSAITIGAVVLAIDSLFGGGDSH